MTYEIECFIRLLSKNIDDKLLLVTDRTRRE